jgi:16S rRNA (cytosine967-C5)-methyltransferase
MALDLLRQVLDDGANLGDVAITTSADPRDRAYARHLAYGALRWRPLKNKDRDIHRLVLLGIFQLWKDGTAGHAAVNETAGCARKLGKPWATGLINAVLRRFQREQTEFTTRLDTREERFAHPAWLLSALQQDWPDDWESVVHANNRSAPLWLRRNIAADSADLAEVLKADGLTVNTHEAADTALRVEPARPVHDLPGFDAGLFSVQDVAAQLAAELLDCKPGHRVLDACAAPGGKTCHLLERFAGLELLALDRSKARLRRVEENLHRNGLDGRATLLAADALDSSNWWDGLSFDRILLDAPCTATGVIRRHPEIKWLRSPEQVDEAVELQSKLLEALWPLLKPGGMLLYATCSILQRENSGQVAAFLEHHADAAESLADVAWGRCAGPGRQILPGELEMDGFYYAALRKTA